ncbi:MAG: 30S ribosomal protein S12 methylthiotransferase RimO [Proteobacteria bacterium]|nr:30S ribosomal protein S12 methylthiotransferase RimO [Pseudomonadota bacterium]MBU1611374.1 30S ribosomal protein S12 methylthiotransferase RimO [Pseudomonadota bacterium]
MDYMMEDGIKVYVVSLGCPKNRVDTERLLGGLGAEPLAVEYPDDAELVLINTCGFIRPAVEESLSAIFDALGRVEAADPRPVVAVVGCLVSRYGPSLAEEMPEVDLWLDTRHLEEWPVLVAEALGRHPAQFVTRKLSTGPGHAYLKVGEGCSHNCAFCTIPSIRGPHQSVHLEDLVEEAERLVDEGVPEIVVVGQDVTAYGQDIGYEAGLVDLVGSLVNIPGLEWLRLMYLYPAGLSDEVLSFLAELGPPLLPYFDVPLQHAHPDVLRAMGRPFARDPRRVVDRIRTYFPEAALRTSIIVGFPGETDAHFDALCDFVREVRFHHLGVFPYHAEDGTPAATMKDQVGEAIKNERRDRLMAIQAEISSDILESYVGESLEVLVEAPNPEWDGLFTGRAWFQAPEVDGMTYLSSGPDGPLQPGTIIKAEIYEAKTYDLVALAE